MNNNNNNNKSFSEPLHDSLKCFNISYAKFIVT